ncbi:MAG: hypothetical protein GXO03_01730 [Aquificae bacterium]|nr:hypothetical protein [Aquificota bacterium]
MAVRRPKPEDTLLLLTAGLAFLSPVLTALLVLTDEALKERRARKELRELLITLSSPNCRLELPLLKARFKLESEAKKLEKLCGKPLRPLKERFERRDGYYLLTADTPAGRVSVSGTFDGERFLFGGLEYEKRR